MDKDPRIDYAIKTSASDEVIIEAVRRETEPIRLMDEFQKLAHQEAREKGNA